MPAADFSEFSYGYAVVREAERLLTTLGAGLTGAPTLPSLLKENTVGYDARLVTVDFSLFLQFKRSFFVSRQHTQGWCGFNGGDPHCTWAYWTVQHYRFDVDTSSNQFAAMRGYETEIDAGRLAGLSRYVAPGFHHENELSHAYLGCTVLDQSVGIRPSTFDAAVPGAHQFSFIPGVIAGVVTSEPIEARAAQLRGAIEDVARPALADSPRNTMTLASLASWAVQHAERAGLSTDFDRQSASDTLAFLNDYASLVGGSLILLGQPDRGDVASPDNERG